MEVLNRFFGISILVSDDDDDTDSNYNNNINYDIEANNTYKEPYSPSFIQRVFNVFNYYSNNTTNSTNSININHGHTICTEQDELIKKQEKKISKFA